MNRSERRHEVFVLQLERELIERGQYSAVGKHMNYYDPSDPSGKQIGEIDVYGIKFDNDSIDLYEVKCGSKHQERANAQLKRARNEFSKHFTFVSLYAYLDGRLKEVH